VNGLDSNHKARGMSLTMNTGYYMPLGKRGWFIEPRAGLVVSRVALDDINVTGATTGALAGVNVGTVNIDQIDSLLGRLSLTIGTSFKVGDIGFQPFVTGSVFREFAGDVKAVSTIGAGTNCTNCAGATLSMSIDRVDTYGQVAVGTAAVFGDSGWLGYARADYKKGDKIEGYSGNIGLRFAF